MGTSEASFPTTLATPAALEPVEAQTCGRAELEDMLLTGVSPPNQETIRFAITLICEHAQSGALLAIAPKEAFRATFCNSCNGGPMICTADNGYMSDLLHGVHISDERFKSAFRLFTEHSATDRWPQDHAEVAARGQPKDGAFLIDTSGYRVACAAKLMGLSPPKRWRSMGTKHEAALACAWEVEDATVLVRSDSGSIHGIIRKGDRIIVLRLHNGVSHIGGT